MEAFYEIALKIAKENKPHILDTQIIKLYALDMVELLRGKKAKQKIQKTLLNDIISYSIRDMSQDVVDQIVSEIQASRAKIGLQFDESTNVLNCAY